LTYETTFSDKNVKFKHPLKRKYCPHGKHISYDDFYNLFKQNKFSPTGIIICKCGEISRLEDL
jgi:RNase P subunit RPR2